MNRRQYIQGGLSGCTGVLAGCAAIFGQETAHRKQTAARSVRNQCRRGIDSDSSSDHRYSGFNRTLQSLIHAITRRGR